MKKAITILAVLLLTILSTDLIFGVEYVTDFDIATAQAKENNENILVIFSTEGCVYCDKLKSELTSIDGIDNYTICILDSTVYKKMTLRRNIRRWPTSLIIDVTSDSFKEIKRLVGYESYKAYGKWINSNQ